MRIIAVVGSLALAGCSLYLDDGDGAGPIPDDDPPCAFMDCDAPEPPPPEPPPPEPPPPMTCGTPAVHLIGVYESRSDHSAGDHPQGAASVHIDRPGHHVVVLSAYEPTLWSVTAGAGAVLDHIYAVGHHDQAVAPPPGVPTTVGPGPCGYSWPYNGGGCDTAELIAWTTAHAGALTTFHGCYHASAWTLEAGGGATSDCATALGYQVDSLEAVCGGDHDGDWTPAELATETPYTGDCTGPRFVRFSDAYGLWVGAALCGAGDRYKLFLSAQPERGYLEIADFAGHGQDHCELVDADFRIADEDDITSGGCADCAIGGVIDPRGVPVYARAHFGEPFTRVLARDWADLTTPSYACGVSLASDD